MTTDEMNRIVRDVTLGVPPPVNESAEAKEFRKKVTPQVKKIIADGKTVDAVFDP